jgi:apolipoprotein N-acyltransferase
MSYIISCILGLIASLGQPPSNHVLASLCAFALFFHFLGELKTAKKAIRFSFCFGYGYCVYSHHWFSESLLAFGDKLLWLYPFGLLLIPAFFALYFAVAGYLIHKFARNNIFIIAVIWLSIELVRSYGYIEFPWFLAGYIWSDSKIISQSVSLFGIWGLSFLTIIWAGAIKEIILRRNFSIISIAFISFISCYIYGQHHLDSPLTSQDIKVRIIQANLDQNADSRSNNRYDNLLKHIELSQSAKDFDYIIWPEGAIEYNMSDSLLDLVKLASPTDGSLILSSNRIQQTPAKHFNSLFAINSQGKVIDYYDKFHLVPLGEYIPFRIILPSFINKITPGENDFTPGKEIRPLKTNHPFLPSICYDATFPENVSSFYTWILNVTNDGWFGTSIGPHQHIALAQFRSIEQGVPMARAALTGVSAIIDSFGSISSSIPLLKAGIIDAKLPGYITNFTYYHNYGNNMTIGLLFVIFSLVLLFSRVKKYLLK